VPIRDTPVRSPSAGSMRHAVEFRGRVEVVDPRLLRANKYLPAWHQFISLAKGSKTHVVGFWLIARRCGIDRCPAVGDAIRRRNVQFTNSDRVFFIQLYRWCPSVLKAMLIIRPETPTAASVTCPRLGPWGWSLQLSPTQQFHSEPVQRRMDRSALAAPIGEQAWAHEARQQTH
jgi:hypothetical protein